MLEKAFHGSKGYWTWIIVLLVIIGIGLGAYANQFQTGLALTGMSRDVSWGLYIAQFTFFVGVAASGVMVAIPFYLHDYKKFGPLLIFGEFMAVAAVLVALLFIIVDLGYPTRILNVILYPTPHSILFWDMCVLSSYLIINFIIAWTALGCERKGTAPKKWVRILSLIAIPLAVSIHTVTAFIYSGMPGRSYWLSAIIAGRFLSSAFAAGPSLLLLICFIMKRVSSFRIINDAVESLAKIVVYAMIINVFFFLLEVFTAFYSNIPGHMAALQYLLFGYNGDTSLVPFMWAAAVLAFLGIILILVRPTRRNHKTLAVALISIFLACWLDKGINFVLAGFEPTSFGHIIDYIPTANEIMIICGVFAIGLLALTIFYKMAITVRAERDQGHTELMEAKEAEEAQALEAAKAAPEA